MTRFRLLQASDLHLAVKPYQWGLPDSWRDVLRGLCSPSLVSSQDPDLLTAFAAFAASVPPDGVDYDRAVLSGDEATTGRAADLRFARAFIEASAGSPGLAGTPATLALVPGNHDRFGPASGLNRPGNRNFDAVFGNYWGAGPGGIQPLCAPLVKDGVWLVLLGADFTLRARDLGNWLPFAWCGQGRAYPDVVATLRAASHQARQGPGRTLVVWVVHFIPFAASDWLQLLDAFNLLAAARDEKVLAVLCGHTHKRSALLLDPRAPDVPFCLCGSTTQYHEPNGNFLNLIDITLDSAEGAPAVSLHSFEYSSFSGQFE